MGGVVTVRGGMVFYLDQLGGRSRATLRAWAAAAWNLVSKIRAGVKDTLNGECRVGRVETPAGSLSFSGRVVPVRQL